MASPIALGSLGISKLHQGNMRLCKAQNTVSQFRPVIEFTVLYNTKYCAESSWACDEILRSAPFEEASRILSLYPEGIICFAKSGENF